MLAQVHETSDAEQYVQWLDGGLWALLALCVAAVIAGGATITFSGPSHDSRTWGLRMVLAGLVGALAAVTLSSLTRFFADLIIT